MYKKPLISTIKNYIAEEYCSFHTPGHKGRGELIGGITFPTNDLTELPGLDILHSPQGVIAEAQKRAAQVFGAEESYFLINGGTAGNHAMFLSLDQRVSNKVLIERNAHRSVISGLVLSGLDPEYIEPVIHPDFNLPLGLDIGNPALEEKLTDNTFLAWHFTYPSYYGSLINLNYFIRKRNENNLKTAIFVDQAHGSHYVNNLFPKSAIPMGADIVLNSTHKTLGALTQAAMLHVQGNLINRVCLRQALEMVQSSSPSYLLMSSLEQATESARLYNRWQEMYSEVEELQKSLENRVRLLSAKDIGSYGITNIDWSKILINTSGLGIEAKECVEYLRKSWKIEPELWDKYNILFMLGIGNTAKDIKTLNKGLSKFLDLFTKIKDKPVMKEEVMPCFPKVPKHMTPREAFFSRKRQVPVKESKGLIAAETISPYPPGIPIIVMGEEITMEIIELMRSARSRRWQGWDGLEEDMVWVVDQ